VFLFRTNLIFLCRSSCGRHQHGSCCSVAHGDGERSERWHKNTVETPDTSRGGRKHLTATGTAPFWGYTNNVYKLTCISSMSEVSLCLQWGSSSHLLAVCSSNSSSVVVLSEHVMCSHYSQQMAAVQLTPTQLGLANFNTNTHITFHADTHIRAVQVTKVTHSHKALF